MERLRERGRGEPHRRGVPVARCVGQRERHVVLGRQDVRRLQNISSPTSRSRRSEPTGTIYRLQGGCSVYTMASTCRNGYMINPLDVLDITGRRGFVPQTVP